MRGAVSQLYGAYIWEFDITSQVIDHELLAEINAMAFVAGISPVTSLDQSSQLRMDSKTSANGSTIVRAGLTGRYGHAP